MDQLSRLESQSLYILREAYRKFPKMAALWSMGKDSTVLLWLTRKAFLGRVPFPVVHIDTSYKIPGMIAWRDQKAKEWGFDLIVGTNKEALDAGMSAQRGRLLCCTALKTEALKRVVVEQGFSAIALGIRRDEEGTRAKERYFSPRGLQSQWDFADQPPELWDQFRTDFEPGTHVRVHPLLDWTELNVWQYIKRERIPVIDLYFARQGRRYRSIGCQPCSAAVESNAANVPQIIAELGAAATSERAGRAQDLAEAHAMQKLRAKGYM